MHQFSSRNTYLMKLLSSNLKPIIICSLILSIAFNSTLYLAIGRRKCLVMPEIVQRWGLKEGVWGKNGVGGIWPTSRKVQPTALSSLGQVCSPLLLISRLPWLIFSQDAAAVEAVSSSMERAPLLLAFRERLFTDYRDVRVNVVAQYGLKLVFLIILLGCYYGPPSLQETIFPDNLNHLEQRNTFLFARALSMRRVKTIC